MKKLLTLASIASFAFIVNTYTAQAANGEIVKEHRQQMVYELYAGGFNAVQAKLDVHYQSKDRYRLELFAVTKGFLGKLVPWEGTFESEGWRLDKETEKPELHQSTAVFDDETDIKKYEYGKDGSFKHLTVIENGKDKTPETLDDTLVQGTTDALTATLQAMQSVAEKGTCEGEDEVFDGKRRFKLVFRHQADDELKATKYNEFSGTAARCEVEVMPIAGAWHKKPRGWLSIQEQGREKGSLPTVWLAKLSEDGPAIPVKLRVKTDYGTLFMHMVGYESSEQPDEKPIDLTEESKLEN